MRIRTLDSRDFREMGFLFETDEEVKAFAQIIRKEVKVRICKALLGSVFPELLKEFYNCTDEYEEEIWLGKNYVYRCLILNEQVEQLYKQIEKYRSRIPGAILTIEAMDLSVRIYNCLKRAGLDTVDKVAAFNKIDDLSKIRNLSWKCVNEVQEKLQKFMADKGLH